MKTINIISIFAILLLLGGCSTQTISEIKDQDHVGKTVEIKGIVQNSFKLGSISGYKIKDVNGDIISISSDELPEEGKTVVVKGILMKDTIFGYYIKE